MKSAYQGGEKHILENQNDLELLRSRIGNGVACVKSFGCQLNVSDGEKIKGVLAEIGYSFTDDMERANLILFNTCAVRENAEERVFGSIGAIKRLKRNNPNLIIGLCGCMAQEKKTADKIKASYSFVDLIFGTFAIDKLPELIAEVLNGKKYVVDINEYGGMTLNENIKQLRDGNSFKASVPIMYGCNNFCSYCIVPYVRGSVRSKSFNKVIEEAKHLAHHGHKEIVLTGIHTGHYEDSGHDLTDLINELSKIEELKRIRISSIEITELNDKFLDMLGKNDKVCNHLHIPLQAGSDEILKRMNRKYDLKYYEEKINKIRSIRPDISISTDIIVGFPYETEELFTSTLKFSEKMKFSKIHVFPYSIRKGTAAASMSEQIDESIKKDRVKRLMALSEKMEEEYYNKFKGKSLDILVEEVNDNVSIGHTSNYLKIEVPEKLNKNEIYTVTYNGGK